MLGAVRHTIKQDYMVAIPGTVVENFVTAAAIASRKCLQWGVEVAGLYDLDLKHGEFSMRNIASEHNPVTHRCVAMTVQFRSHTKTQEAIATIERELLEAIRGKDVKSGSNKLSELHNHLDTLHPSGR